MPFNTLLLNCLIPGTSFGEQDNKVSIRPGPHEVTLFFCLDDQSNENCAFRSRLQHEGRLCDLLVFLARFPARPAVESVTLCLVELKGGRVHDALQQVESTFDTLKTRLTSLLTPNSTGKHLPW